ncbi:hypothetical protein AAIH32_02750 [Pseudarthrobacter oxydans]|uniref:hypothetical protein n=1 Tax=Pseudarthrobacter oxydans TaxID=1671 RepID=UPI003D2A10AB
MNTNDTRATAFGFGQRKSWVFFAWWYPSIIGFSGAVYALLALIVGQDPGLGTSMMILGAALATSGWVLTLKPRFTRKHPKPASDIPRVDQGIRITPGIIWTVLGGAAILMVLLLLSVPEAASPESLPVLGLLMAWPAGVSAGLAYTRWLMINSGRLYADWSNRG